MLLGVRLQCEIFISVSVAYFTGDPPCLSPLASSPALRDAPRTKWSLSIALVSYLGSTTQFAVVVSTDGLHIVLTFPNFFNILHTAQTISSVRLELP